MLGKWGWGGAVVENDEPAKPLSQMWVLHEPDTSPSWIPRVGRQRKLPSHPCGPASRCRTVHSMNEELYQLTIQLWENKILFFFSLQLEVALYY